MNLSGRRSSTPKRSPLPMTPTPAPRGVPPVAQPTPPYRIAPSAPVQVTGTPRPQVPPTQPLGTAARAAAAAAPAPVAPAESKESAYATLSTLLSAVIDVAYSDSLPDDPPGSERPLETRRRAYVQTAALAYVNHNRTLMHDPAAGPHAVTLATTLVGQRQAEVNARARRMNGVPTRAPDAVIPGNQMGTPQAQRTLAASVPPVSPVRTPVSPLFALVEKAHAKMHTVRYYNEDRDGRNDLAREPRLLEAALLYLDAYVPTGDDRTDAFMASVRSKLDVRPEYRLSSLSDAQARAILNIWLDRYCDERGVPRPPKSTLPRSKYRNGNGR